MVFCETFATRLFPQTRNTWSKCKDYFKTINSTSFNHLFTLFFDYSTHLFQPPIKPLPTTHQTFSNHPSNLFQPLIKPLPTTHQTSSNHPSHISIQPPITQSPSNHPSHNLHPTTHHTISIQPPITQSSSIQTSHLLNLVLMSCS